MEHAVSALLWHRNVAELWIHTARAWESAFCLVALGLLSSLDH